MFQLYVVTFENNFQKFPVSPFLNKNLNLELVEKQYLEVRWYVIHISPVYYVNLQYGSCGHYRILLVMLLSCSGKYIEECKKLKESISLTYGFPLLF